MSLVVRVARPAEYTEADRVTAGAYQADDLLRRTDGVIDRDYEADLADASRRAREARWSQTTCDTPTRLLSVTTYSAVMPKAASRCCRRSCAASSIALCRHSEAR